MDQLLKLPEILHGLYRLSLSSHRARHAPSITTELLMQILSPMDAVSKTLTRDYSAYFIVIQAQDFAITMEKTHRTEVAISHEQRAQRT